MCILKLGIIYNHCNDFNMSPYQTLNRNIYNRIIFDSWPDGHFHEINDLETVKSFYNSCYEKLKKRLEDELNKSHPAAWILEAYKQLELWTAIHHGVAREQISGNKDFAPIGRYGWRYVIEISLERLNTSFSYEEIRPTEQNLNNVFTCLFGMGQCSEYSNYLHFLRDKLVSTQIFFSSNLIVKGPKFSKDGEVLFKKIEESLFSKLDWEQYSQFSPNSPLSFKKVDEFLLKHFSINTSDINLIIRRVSNAIGAASIIVQPYDDFVKLIEDLSGFSEKKIKSLIEISFLSIDAPNYITREFLRKNQQTRMLFNAGVLIKLDSHFEAIYDLMSSKQKFVTNSNYHIIISPGLFADWLDVFVFKLVLGQRDDLKQNSLLKQDIIEIESFYRIKVFEVEVMKLLKNKSYYCFNLSKVNSKRIECGEIDIIAYSPIKNNLYVIECKAYAPVIDARGLGQVLKDHYQQKKYHKKFMRKISWVESEIETIKSIFFEDFKIKISDNFSTNSFFITLSSNLRHLIESNYKIMTFQEFDNFLENEA